MMFGELLLYVVAYIGLFSSLFFLLTLFENRKDIFKTKLPKILPKVTVLVPCANEERTLAKTLKSLLALNYPKKKLEIIVIDDNSTDKTVKIAKKFGAKIKIGTYIIYLIIFILGLEWFYNRPSLRYGGYHILPLLFFIPISIKLASSDISIKKYTKIVLILICITTFTFIGRNINRVVKEVQVYDYKPLKKTFYFIDESHFRIQKQMDKKIKKLNDCTVIVNKCDSSIKIILGKIIFINE